MSTIQTYYLKIFFFSKDENFYLSSIGISKVLSLILFNSKNKSKQQLENFLNIDKKFLNKIIDFNDRKDNIRSFLKFYLKNNSSREKFFNLRQKNNFQIESIDFMNTNELNKNINEWIRNLTKLKINEINQISSLRPSTNVLIAVFDYFSSKWLSKFSLFNTDMQDFFHDDNTFKRVYMMKSYSEKFKCMQKPEGLEAISCEFPFYDSTRSLTILLPEEGVKLKDIEKNITLEKIERIISANSETTNVIVFLPKFKIDYEADVNYLFFLSQKLLG